MPRLRRPGVALSSPTFTFENLVDATPVENIDEITALAAAGLPA